MTYCCISVFRVATIDDDIPGLKKRNLRKNKCITKSSDLTMQDSIFHTHTLAHTTHQFINEVVHSLSSLDQQDDPPGLLQLGHHVLKRLCSNHLGALCLILQKVMHLGNGPVVSTDLLDRFGENGLKKEECGTDLLPGVAKKKSD